MNQYFVSSSVWSGTLLPTVFIFGEDLRKKVISMDPFIFVHTDKKCQRLIHTNIIQNGNMY
jgi:hypothetical protein